MTEPASGRATPTQLSFWPVVPPPPPSRPPRRTRQQFVREVGRLFAEVFGERGQIVEYAAMTASAPFHTRCSQCGVLWWTTTPAADPCSYCASR
jgi:hypothetical protein